MKLNNISEFVQGFLKERYLYIVFIFSLFATFGSLYFSEGLKLEPCLLCWYQRILIYPLFILSTVAILTNTHLSRKFILSLSIPGMLIAVYHVYIQMTGSENALGTCAVGTPCNRIDLAVGGFLTIPMMSAIAFITINLLLLIGVYLKRKE